MEIDRQLIKQVLEYGSDPSGEEHPIDKWWWHLEKIAQRTYPASLLPEHLREIYEKYKIEKKNLRKIAESFFKKFFKFFSFFSFLPCVRKCNKESLKN